MLRAARRCYRAATWYDDVLDVVWLVAAAIHRDDDVHGDAYAYFKRLEESGRLYPSADDRERFVVWCTAGELAQEADLLIAARREVLALPDGRRRTVVSRRGLTADMWAERVEGLGLLALRLCIRLEHGGYLTDVAVGTLVGAVFSDSVAEYPDPDQDFAKVRYFEEYIEAL